MQEKIFDLLKRFMAVESVSCSDKENEAAQFIHSYFAEIPYFKANPDYYGLYEIKDDPYGRTVPYAFLKGNSPKTVVIMGHYDVVGVEDYGEAQPLAYCLGDELAQALAKMDLPAEARADMESGEYLWGRGVYDMKSGLVVDMVLMEEYAKKAEEGTLPGSIFFMGVPDEESYSAGMRAGVTLLSDFKNKYGLDLNLLMDPEPCSISDNNEMVYTVGSVGKTMPVVMVQGITAHAGHRFNGISPLGILSRIELKVEESLDFTDSYRGEATMPPTWANMRDMKKKYDVSIPQRASGYMTVLSFDTTPEQIMNRLREISEESFKEAVESLDALYQEFKKINKLETREKISYEPLVMTFGELSDKLKAERGEAFEEFYADCKRRAEERILSGEVNYQQATVDIMEETLNFADIKKPLVLLGFAPPYYPAITSDYIPGREGMGEELFNFMSDYMSRFGRGVVIENYTMGISDMSYAGLDHPFNTAVYSANTPVWGRMYSIDFEGIANLNMPCCFCGPMGKDAHQWTERILKKSLFEECPEFNRALIDKYMTE